MIQIMVKNKVNIFNFRAPVNHNVNLNGSVVMLSHNIQAQLSAIHDAPELMFVINGAHTSVIPCQPFEETVIWQGSRVKRFGCSFITLIISMKEAK